MVQIVIASGCGEGVFNNGVGIGMELGYLSPFESVGDGLGTFSVNGSYHFIDNSDQKTLSHISLLAKPETGICRTGNVIKRLEPVTDAHAELRIMTDEMFCASV